MPPFTDFEHDEDKPGVHWDRFVTALGIWVYMQEQSPTVAAAALSFNTTPGAVRKAVMEHPWLVDDWPAAQEDPTWQLITSDGE